MSTTIDDDVTTETPPKPTKRQRQAANIADAASGGIKMLLLKLVLLGILDAIAVYAVLVLAGFSAVGAEAVPMPAIPAMGSVWQYWGIAEADIINGADPVATWQKLTSDVQAAIK